MDTPDPITPLTPVEEAFVLWLDATSSREEIMAELKGNLQTAIEIELATIPIYLYAYYSLVRNNESGETIGAAQLYANKAGGLIMSVAVEEMLHMSLSSNILYAMGVAPRLYGMAPAQYPTGLPYHNPDGPPGPDGSTAVQIPLARLSFEQLWHFLQIEYPEQWDALPQDRNWDTIGQFYSYIRCLLRTRFVTDADFQSGAPDSAIQPYNYSPNNVDTIYPDAGFDPWQPAPPAPKPSWADDDQSAAAAAVYPDTADSHAGPTELITISSLSDAAEAIDTICDQGEGCPVPEVGPSPDDDPSKDEDSHYVKFLNLQAQYADYPGCMEQLPPQPPAPAPIVPPVNDAELFAAGVLVDMPDNPARLDYPDLYREIADFNSALFQYMLIMCETIYRVPSADQKLFFNEGLHRSMIWVMDKYIRTIRQIPIPSGVHQGKMMGPLFENVDLGKPAASFAGLTTYGNAAIAAANTLISQLQGDEVAEEVIEAVDALLHADEKPAQLKVEQDGNLIGTLQNVIYYIGVALTKTGTGGVSMHLPDVGPYWSDAQ
jgi:ferritin-like protein